MSVFGSTRHQIPSREVLFTRSHVNSFASILDQRGEDVAHLLASGSSASFLHGTQGLSFAQQRQKLVLEMKNRQVGGQMAQDLELEQMVRTNQAKERGHGGRGRKRRD